MIFRLARQTTTSRKSHYRECMGELCHVHRYMVLFCVCISLLRCGRRVVQCSPGMHLFFVRFRTEVYYFCGFPCRMRCNTCQTVNRQRAAFFFALFPKREMTCGEGKTSFHAKSEVFFAPVGRKKLIKLSPFNGNIAFQKKARYGCSSLSRHSLWRRRTTPA